MRVVTIVLVLAAGIAIGLTAGPFLPGGAPGAAEANCTDQPCPDPPCCNGDINGDGAIDISDAVSLLAYLFAGGPPPAEITCEGGDCERQVAGTWNIDVGYRPNECEMPGPAMPFAIRVEQDGCNLTVISGEDDTVEFPGTLCGDLGYFSGVYETPVGTFSLDGYFHIDARETLHGVTSWVIKNPAGGVCRGVEVWQAQRAE